MAPGIGSGVQISLARGWPSKSFDSGRLFLWATITILGVIILPPFAYLLSTSLTVEQARAPAFFGFDNFEAAWSRSGFDIWRVTLIYAVGSSLLAIALGGLAAWLAARTNAYCRGFALVGALVSMSSPVIVKGIGWILLLGPNKGVVNEALRGLLGLQGVPIKLFGLGGMISIEAILWIPVVFLLLLPAFSAMNPALEEAASMSGAGRAQVIWRITLRLASPALIAVALLTFIRAMESFEVPLLIGSPGRVETLTTVIYDSIHAGFRPRYGEASAYAISLLALVVIPLLASNRLARDGGRFATIGGRGFQGARIDLGGWRAAAGVYLALIPLALVAPLAILFWASFLPIYEPPSMADFGRLSLNNYRSLLDRPQIIAGMRNGALTAGLAACLVVAIASIAAWLASRRREPSRRALDILCSLPLAFPGIVLGTAVLIEFLHLRFIPLYGTIGIMVFAFLVRFMPYGFRICHASLAGLHPELEEAARVCGASGLGVLSRVVAPAIMPAISAAWIYVFLNSIRDLSLPVALAGPRNPLIATTILDLWHDGKIPAVGAISILLAMLAAFLGWVFTWLTRREGNAI